MTDFAQCADKELIDEIEARGYDVYDDHDCDFDIDNLDDQELINALESRGFDVVDTGHESLSELIYQLCERRKQRLDYDTELDRLLSRICNGVGHDYI